MTDLELMRQILKKFEDCEAITLSGGYVFYKTPGYGKSLGLCDFVGINMPFKDSEMFPRILFKYKKLTQYPCIPAYKFDTRDLSNGHPKQLRIDWLKKVIKLLEEENN